MFLVVLPATVINKMVCSVSETTLTVLLIRFKVTFIFACLVSQLSKPVKLTFLELSDVAKLFAHQFAKPIWLAVVN